VAYHNLGFLHYFIKKKKGKHSFESSHITKYPEIMDSIKKMLQWFGSKGCIILCAMIKGEIGDTKCRVSQVGY
jgi:hypothetical protein